jgi:hypothetical protein
VIGHAREVELEMMRAGARGGGVRQRERGSVRAGGGAGHAEEIGTMRW